MGVDTRRESLQWAWAGVVLAAAVGALIPLAGPTLAVAPVAALAAAYLFQTAQVRAAFVIIGGLLVFQSSSGLSLLKGAYFAGLVVCALIALRQLDHVPLPARRFMAPLAVGSALVLGMVAISTIQAFNHGQLVGDWARDTVSYLLLAFVPVFALDASRGGPEFTRTLLMVAGGVATFAFTVTWLDRRGFATLPSVGLPSLAFVAGLFSYLTARAFHARHSLKWVMYATVLLVALLATGTRSVVLLVLAPVAMALLAGSGQVRRIRQVVAGAMVALLLIGAGVQTGVISSLAVGRLTSGSFGNPDVYATALSAKARSNARRAARSAMERSPLVGVGAGARFAFTDPVSGDVVVTTTTDTVLTTPAKYGWLGFLVLAGVVAAYCIRPLRLGKTAVGLAGLGLLVVLTAMALVVSPLEDKGLALVLMLLLAVAASEAAASPVSIRRGGRLVNDDQRLGPRSRRAV